VKTSRLAKLMRVPRRVNDDWIHDVNTAMRAIEDCLFTMKLLASSLAQPPGAEVRAIRTKAWEELRGVRDASLLQFRKDWYYDLVCTPSMRRVYRRMRPFDKVCASRSVLICKNEALAEEGIPDTLGEMKAAGKLMRLNSDCAVFYTTHGAVDVWIGQVDWRNLPVEFPKIGRLGPDYFLFLDVNRRFRCPSFASAYSALPARKASSKE
jgi:hypothetical protein